MKDFNRDSSSHSISMLEVVLFCILPLAIILLPIVVPTATWYYFHRQRRNDRKTEKMYVIPEDWVPELERPLALPNSVPPWAPQSERNSNYLYYSRSGPSINLVPPSPPTSGPQTPGLTPRADSGIHISNLDLTANARWNGADQPYGPEGSTECHQPEVLLADGSRLIIPFKLHARPPSTTSGPAEREGDSDSFSDSSTPTQHSPMPVRHDNLLKVPSSDRLRKPINIPDGPIPYKPISQRRRTSYSHG